MRRDAVRRLWEPSSGQNEKTGLLTGRTDGNVVVDFPGDASRIGTFADVRVTAARNWILRGELEEAND